MISCFLFNIKKHTIQPVVDTLTAIFASLKLLGATAPSPPLMSATGFTSSNYAWVLAFLLAKFQKVLFFRTCLVALLFTLWWAEVLSKLVGTFGIPHCYSLLLKLLYGLPPIFIQATLASFSSLSFLLLHSLFLKVGLNVIDLDFPHPLLSLSFKHSTNTSLKHSCLNQCVVWNSFQA